MDLCGNKTPFKLKRRQKFILDVGKIMIIKCGIVIPSLLRTDGNEKGIKLLGKGSMLGIAQLFNNLERPFSVHVVEDLECCIVEAKYIEEKCMSSTEFARSVIQQFAHHLAISAQNMEDRAFVDSTIKISRILKRSNKDINKEILLTHEEIALLVGINRVTVSRAIANIQPATTVNNL
jgi:CRP-like cAMP-binding protein